MVVLWPATNGRLSTRRVAFHMCRLLLQCVQVAHKVISELDLYPHYSTVKCSTAVHELTFTVQQTLCQRQHSAAQRSRSTRLTWSSGRMTVLKAKAMDPIAPIALKVPVAVVSWMPKSLAGVVLPIHVRRCQLSEMNNLRVSATMMKAS